jgi:hypothetical protein
MSVEDADADAVERDDEDEDDEGDDTESRSWATTTSGMAEWRNGMRGVTRITASKITCPAIVYHAESRRRRRRRRRQEQKKAAHFSKQTPRNVPAYHDIGWYDVDRQRNVGDGNAHTRGMYWPDDAWDPIRMAMRHPALGGPEPAIGASTRRTRPAIALASLECDAMKRCDTWWKPQRDRT